MKKIDFHIITTAPHLQPFFTACNGNQEKAMVLVGLNQCLYDELELLHTFFTNTLRHRINRHLSERLGEDWLQAGIAPGGIFDNGPCRRTAEIIRQMLAKQTAGSNSGQEAAALGFGFWRYCFARPQFKAMGSKLLDIFPAKPSGSVTKQYNAAFVFNQLAAIDQFQKRMQRKEPLVLTPKYFIKTTDYVRSHNKLLKLFFDWLSVDEAAPLNGLYHINTVCDQVDVL
jgi:hypothetical protein